MKQKLIKLTFTLPQESYCAMQKIAENENLTLNYVLRRAFKTEYFIKEQEKYGKKILVFDGKKFEEMVRV